MTDTPGRDPRWQKVALVVEYNGQAYSGWQSQHHAPSVQAVLEKALSRIADHPVAVVAAGRTDAGVHAAGQTVHFETVAQRPPRAWTLGCNSHLPADISVRWAGEVPADFHARYSAQWRRYRYLICDRATRPALLAGRVAWYHYALDASRMQQAAGHLPGEHDFSSFRAAECQSRTAFRRLDEITVRRVGELVVVDVQANAFLHHMVRNLAGVLLAVGRGEREPEWAAEVLAARDRRVGGITAPADGLYFMGAFYGEHVAVPTPVDVPPPQPALVPGLAG